MNNIIPFTKELDFHTKVSEILSISLEREYKIENDSINGNLLITGDYKTHEVSANEIPFSFKIPFTIELTDNIDKESISLEINDFSYDIKDDSKIVVHIELSFNAPTLPKEERIDVDFIPVPEEEPIEEKEEIPHKEETSIQQDEEFVSYEVHTIKNDETIDLICSIYNTDKSELAEYNDLTNITPGMKIIIPAKDE